MFFNKFISRLVPRVRADDDEEIEDPQETLRNECKQDAHAAHLFEIYEKCNARVNSKSKTSETCAEELYDFLHHIDHCVSLTLFSRLK